MWFKMIKYNEPMINFLLLDKTNNRLIKEKQDNITDLIKDNQNILWLDLEDPTDEEITILSDKFKFHELLIEDCIFPQSQSKIDDFGEYLFIIIHGVNSQDKELKLYQLNIFIGKNFIVTVHEEKLTSIHNLLRRCNQNPNLLSKGPDFVLHALVDTIVDNYSPILDSIENQIDDVEDEILKNPTRDTMAKIFKIKKDILFMRKATDPQKVVLSSLSRKYFACIKKIALPYFRDIYDHITRVGGILDTYREMITSLLEVYLAGVSAKLNEVIKGLTIIGSIFLPPMLIASYYGMNIKFPEERMLGTFILPFIWGITFCIIAGLLFFFKRKKWL
jgi:magnesium transporter